MTEVAVACNLRTEFGEVRDQGPRPTCLAFAVSDAHAANRPGWVPLSCEYAFYHAQRRGQRPPSVGSRLFDMLSAVRDNGQPQEENWPYLSSNPTDLSTWKPPADVGELFRRESDVKQRHLDDIIHTLDGGSPVLVIMCLSDSFYNCAGHGIILQSTGEKPDQARRHAVVAVGHGMIKGERSVLIRNSWGTTWGDGGHAWLTESYLIPCLIRTAILSEDPNDRADRRTT